SSMRHRPVPAAAGLCLLHAAHQKPLTLQCECPLLRESCCHNERQRQGTYPAAAETGPSFHCRLPACEFVGGGRLDHIFFCGHSVPVSRLVVLVCRHCAGNQAGTWLPPGGTGE